MWGISGITAVDQVELDELTDEDALPDGFATAAQLRKSSHGSIPTQLADGYRAFRVCFALLPPEE